MKPCLRKRSAHGQRVIDSLRADKLPLGVKDWPENTCGMVVNRATLEPHEIQAISGVQTQLNEITREFDHQYDHHMEYVSDSYSESISDWTPPEYDSEQDEIHPVLRTYSEPDVGETESSGEDCAVVPFSVEESSLSTRSLRRMSSQEAVSSFIRGTNRDSEHSDNTEPVNRNVGLDVHVNNASSSSVARTLNRMNSQEAVERYLESDQSMSDSD